MKICVFLGPTLPLPEAETLLPADYLPPAAAGDVYALASAREPPEIIAVVDGLFESAPSVWHKEILFALSRGIRVFGAASMGALRAAELAAFGMVGVGGIFEAYRRGDLEDDDEVAVVHGPAEAGYRPLSEAMVNLRDGLAAARDAGAVTPATHDALVRAGKDLFYPDRSWARLEALGRELGLPAEELAALRRLRAAARPDAKRRDARALLERLAGERARGPAPHVPDFAFEPTKYFERLARRADAGGQRDGHRVAGHVRLHDAERADLFRGALLLALARAEARRIGLGATPAEQETAARSLGPPRHLGAGAWADLVEAEASVRALLALPSVDAEHHLLLELARRGALGDASEAASRKWRRLGDAGLGNPTLEDAGLTERDLLAWYVTRFRPIGRSVEAHAAELGFGSSRAFYLELLGEYLHAGLGAAK